MGKQQVFAKMAARLALAGFDLDFKRNARQRYERRPSVLVESQRHQRRARFDDLQAELAGDAERKIGRADLWYRQAASGNHDAAGGNRFNPALALGAFQTDPKSLRRFVDRRDLARHAPLHTTSVALSAQHGDHIFRGAIAKQLATMFFVVTDAMPLHQPEKILRRVA